MNKFLGFLLLLLVTPVSAKVVEKIVAIVNDDIITLSDIDRFKSRISSGGLVDESILPPSEVKKMVNDRKAIVEHLIDQKIIDYEVKKQGLAVTVERVEGEIRSITKRNQISREQLKSALAGKGVKFSEYQDFVKTSLERNSLVEKEVSSKIKISDEDVSAFYIRSKGPNAGTIFEYTLSHILVLPKNGGEKAASRRAKRVLEKLQEKKQSFEKIAAEFSEDPAFSSGGLLGTFKAGEMLKEIDTKVRTLDVGEHTDIVKTRMGFQIIKVLKKTLVPDPEYERSKERIRAELFGETFRKQFRSWLDQKRQEAFIRIN